jgi:hypothetical protein
MQFGQTSGDGLRFTIDTKPPGRRPPGVTDLRN